MIRQEIHLSPYVFTLQQGDAVVTGDIMAATDFRVGGTARWLLPISDSDFARIGDGEVTLKIGSHQWSGRIVGKDNGTHDAIFEGEYLRR